MKIKVVAVTVFFAVASQMVIGGSCKVDVMLDSLSRLRNYAADVELAITLPITMHDVDYRVAIFTRSADDDKLSPVDYLVEVRDTLGAIRSFEAYNKGNYYNFSAGKLREYHWEQDSLPFKKMGGGTYVQPPVQRSSLFTQLIPMYMADELKALVGRGENDVKYSCDTIIDGVKMASLQICERTKGYKAKEREYLFDANTYRPMRVKVVSNPGMVGEQTLSAVYSNYVTDNVEEISDSVIVNRYKDVFSRYRMSNFAIKTMIGKRLPTFSLPRVDGSRYTWNGVFDKPVIVAWLDSGVATAGMTVEAVRKAVDAMPIDIAVLWVFRDKDLRTITDLVGEKREGELSLVNGRGFAVDCGVTGYPSVAVVDRTGVVCEVFVGYDKDLKNNIVQKGVISIKSKKE